MELPEYIGLSRDEMLGTFRVSLERIRTQMAGKFPEREPFELGDMLNAQAAMSLIEANNIRLLEDIRKIIDANAKA